MIKKKNKRSHNQVQLIKTKRKGTPLTCKQGQPGLSRQTRKPDY
jgi:hypothetical protein